MISAKMDTPPNLDDVSKASLDNDLEDCLILFVSAKNEVHTAAKVLQQHEEHGRTVSKRTKYTPLVLKIYLTPRNVAILPFGL